MHYANVVFALSSVAHLGDVKLFGCVVNQLTPQIDEGRGLRLQFGDRKTTKEHQGQQTGICEPRSN